MWFMWFVNMWLLWVLLWNCDWENEKIIEKKMRKRKGRNRGRCGNHIGTGGQGIKASLIVLIVQTHEYLNQQSQISLIFLDHTKNTYLLWNYFKQGLMIPCVTHVLLELKVLVYYVTFWTATSSLLPPSPAFSSHEMVGVWARHDAWGVTMAQRQPAVEWRRWPL
jgi:hypothetical protein